MLCSVLSESVPTSYKCFSHININSRKKAKLPCRIVVMYKIFVISLLLFASFSKIWASETAKRKPYVLAEYDDENSPTKRRYEYPTCASRDNTNNEVVFSSSGEKFKIEYYCYPMEIEKCAFASGKFMNDYCAFDKSPECGVKENYDYVMKSVLDSDGREVACGMTGKNAKFYRVGYNFEFIPNEPVQKSVYSFCYDKKYEKTWYAEYKIISPHLLDIPDVDDKTFKEEVKTSSFDEEDFGDFAKKKAYFKKVAASSNSELAYRNLLVPPSHMAMDWWKEPLYHIVNQQILRPKFHTAMNWINKYIKDEAKRRLGEVFVRTGVMDIFEFTYEASIWWKLIYDEKRKYAIAVFIHNLEEPPGWIPCGEITPKNTCVQHGWRDIIPKGFEEYVHCCTPHYLLDLFNFDPVEIFDLIELPEEKYIGEKKDCKLPPRTATESLSDPSLEGQKMNNYLLYSSVAV